MKIICTQKNLHQGLTYTTRIINSGAALPVLNNILFKTDQGRLKISATNLEIAVNTWVGGKIEEEGELTIPAKPINEYIASLPAERIVISAQNETMKLAGENTETHIKGLPAEEFPLIPRVEGEVYGKVNGKDLKLAISEVAYATAFSETQPEISGVLFRFEEKTLTLAATDRYRLAEKKLPLSGEGVSARQIIIPARAVGEIGRIMGEGEVEIFLTESQACFRADAIELITRLIDGQYPDYKQIVPKSFTTEVKINRPKFVQSLKATSVFASDTNNVEFFVNPASKELVIKSQSSQIGDSEIHLGVEGEGEKNSIIFNYRYLLECLNNLTDEEVNLRLISPSSPAEIIPAGREDYLYLVMPIKI
ncbi:MAG: DNA polymerase III subunit beta [Candidatus Doudnabacteria bacterium]|nr:DNA polymerase III subunit beta [Candidatus Doudnabacteria bacterium]